MHIISFKVCFLIHVGDPWRRNSSSSRLHSWIIVSGGLYKCVWIEYAERTTHVPGTTLAGFVGGPRGILCEPCSFILWVTASLLVEVLLGDLLFLNGGEGRNGLASRRIRFSVSIKTCASSLFPASLSPLAQWVPPHRDCSPCSGEHSQTPRSVFHIHLFL